MVGEESLLLGTSGMLSTLRKLTKQLIVQWKIYHTKISLSAGLTTCFFMQEELQPAAHNTYYGFLQAPMLHTPLLLQ
jgi:hypothetical protein